MSKERQRARALRQEARRAEVESAAARRARQERRAAVMQRVVPRRRTRGRRYGALPTRARVQLTVVFLVIQAVAWFFFSGVGVRFSVAVLTVACLLVLVRTRRSPAR